MCVHLSGPVEQIALQAELVCLVDQVLHVRLKGSTKTHETRSHTYVIAHATPTVHTHTNTHLQGGEGGLDVLGKVLLLVGNVQCALQASAPEDTHHTTQR